MSILQQAVSVLVVEDDPGDFGSIRAHLRRSGLGRNPAMHEEKESALWAKTLTEGLSLARSNSGRCLTSVNGATAPAAMLGLAYRNCVEPLCLALDTEQTCLSN